MRLVAFIIAMLLAAVLTTLYALNNPGYVLISRAPWSMEMSLTVFILLLLAGYATFYLLLFILVRLFHIPRDVTRWRAQRNVRQARKALTTGLVKLTEASWVEAEAQFLASMRFSESPLLTYLGAACVNQGQGNIEKRDEYLAAAYRSAPQNHLAIGMTQANLQYLAHQSEQALATLTELRATAPKHKHILKLLAQLYLELRDWTNLVELVPDLRQNNVMNQKEIEALELRAHRELLMLTLPSGSLDVLKKAWGAVPKALRRHSSLVAIYARQLIQQNDMNEAEEFLRRAIDEDWDDRLVDLYGYVKSDRPIEQLELAESWLGSHPENPKLLLALGRLAMQASNDARTRTDAQTRSNAATKARAYLEKCIHLRGPIEAYRELGTLLERLGETDKALVCYRRGLDAIADDDKLPATTRTFARLVSSR